eukprot:g4203.t1
MNRGFSRAYKSSKKGRKQKQKQKQKKAESSSDGDDVELTTTSDYTSSKESWNDEVKPFNDDNDGEDADIESQKEKSDSGPEKSSSGAPQGKKRIDPYVKIELIYRDQTPLKRRMARLSGVGGGIKRTKTCEDGGIHPVWTEEEHNSRMEFILLSSAEATEKPELLITCCDDDFGKDELIGTATYDLGKCMASPGSLFEGESVNLSLDVDNDGDGDVTGKIFFDVKFRAPHSVELWVRRGSHLRDSKNKMHSTSLSDDRPTLALCIFMIIAYLSGGIFWYRFMEGWSWITSAYFSVCILTTVGYGDITPTSQYSKLFTAGYGLLGISVISAAMGIIGGALVASLSETFDDAVDTIDGDDEDDNHMTLKQRKRRAACRARAQKLAFALLTFIVITMGGATFYVYFERMTWIDSIYMSVITLTTIGLGDVSPQTDAGRLVCVFWMLLGVVIVATVVGEAVGLIVEVKQQKLEMKMLQQRLDLTDFSILDSSGDGKINELEYVSMMLVKLGKVAEDDIDDVRAQFRRILPKGRKEISIEDIMKDAEFDF